ncbi:MAG TPA: signal recognition particle subunit SRP19/SEC65 family protein [Thermoplasmata archaeon]|nr:signal recognition particle subunit SRP19/SEC65 family protein [Thermoplasmata archaeon]
MPDHFYVYPAYLEKISRAAGRRVPAAEALTDVTAEEIVDAARRLGAKAEVEAERQYPRRFFTYAGRVKVLKRSGIAKAAFLRALAEELRRRRTAGGSG